MLVVFDVEGCLLEREREYSNLMLKNNTSFKYRRNNEYNKTFRVVWRRNNQIFWSIWISEAEMISNGIREV